MPTARTSPARGPAAAVGLTQQEYRRRLHNGDFTKEQWQRIVAVYNQPDNPKGAVSIMDTRIRDYVQGGLREQTRISLDKVLHPPVPRESKKRKKAKRRLVGAV